MRKTFDELKLLMPGKVIFQILRKRCHCLKRTIMRRWMLPQSTQKVRSVCLLLCLPFCLLFSLSNLFFLPGEDDADDKSAGSAGTEYDDIEEQAHAVSHPQTDTENDPGLPLLPKRPENLLGTALKFTPPHCVFVCLVWAHVRTYCM